MSLSKQALARLGLGAHCEQALRESRASVTPVIEWQNRRLADQLKQESPRGRQIGFAVATERRRRHRIGADANGDPIPKPSVLSQRFVDGTRVS